MEAERTVTERLVGAEGLMVSGRATGGVGVETVGGTVVAGGGVGGGMGGLMIEGPPPPPPPPVERGVVTTMVTPEE